MTLVQLNYLIALDRIRHFRKAAAHLGISQPNLSNQLSNLEDDLGVQLFDRTKKPIQPTLIGEQVIAQARVVVGEAGRLKLIVKGLAGEMAGHLRIGIVPTLSPYLMPLVMPRFSTRYPDVAIEVHEMSIDQTTEHIKRDLIDVGLVLSFRASRGIIDELLFEEPLLCYVSRHHPLFDRETIPTAELRLNDLWLLRKGNALRDQVIALCNPDPHSEIDTGSLHFVSDSLEALKRLVERGQKMTVLPWLAARDPAPHETALIRTFTPPFPCRPVFMIYAKTLPQKQLVDALSQEIKDSVHALIPGDILPQTA